MSNFELQEKAVKAATRFIERKGFELLDTGWTSPGGTQIDLIASDEDTLVFIDVTATDWNGYDELDTRLRAKGVQDDPKKKAIRQAVQGLGGKGGPVRGNDGQRPIRGTRHNGLDAEKMGLRIRGDGRRRVPRKRLPEDQQGL